MSATNSFLLLSGLLKPTCAGRLARRIKPPPAKYRGRYTVTLIPGDGFGPELLNYVCDLFSLLQRISGAVECLKIITQSSSLRTAGYAFQLARDKGRRKVTAVHEANIMKLADDLFLQCCKEVASGYLDIAFKSMIVDNTTMQLHTADIGGLGTTLDVMQSIMKAIQSGGPRTSKLY